MKKIFTYLSLVLVLLFGISQSSLGQNPVSVGSGSYAEYPPLNQAAKPYLTGSAGWGDQSQTTTHKMLYVVDTCTRPIPTNKWWTDLVMSKFSGDLWAYPGVVSAQSFGAYIKFPKTWSADGTVLTPTTELDIKGTNFSPASALARRWGDWTVDFVMKESDSKYMAVTLARGVPFTWFEFTGITPVISGAATAYLNDAGAPITFPFTGDHLDVQINGDDYGIFAPANTTFALNGSNITVNFSGSQQFLVVSTMPSVASMATFYNYAYVIPRDSKVSWSYSNTTGKLTTNWNLTTQNLTGGSQLNTIQGFLPHHYKNTSLGFALNGINYATARGTMKCATGNAFSITYNFNGILPSFPAPTDTTLANPFNKASMKSMIDAYAGKAGYGNDTYWGGKDLTGMGHYMNYAKQTGDVTAYNQIKTNLKNALTDWYTYTPGESSHFFSMFANFKGLVGMNSSYGSEQFNDHHFHYGYFTYATAMLGFEDKDFITKYGDMAKMLAKDYANWDRTDTRFPFMRHFDPWEGHSYAGGFGSAADGNGQESSSEAMQGWGGLYMLGTSLGDNAMRDAGIFGWTTEARATAEYWFDRDHVTVSPTSGNYDYTKYTHPYCSNITTRGIGWWTWFSGDPIWMHSIQWLPISPLLKYLYEDLNFAKWDYNKMWSTKQTGDWSTDLGNDSGLGNVVLSYLQISNPDTAAIVYDWMAANKKSCVTDVNTGGISYYTLHSHRSLGEIQWNKFTSIPTSTVYTNSKTGVTTYVVYNPATTEQTCTAYNTSGTVLATFNVPAQKLISYSTAAALTSIQISSPALTVPVGSTLQMTANGLDQYGASSSATVTWSVNGGGTINASGLFTATTNGSWVVTAKSGSITATKTIRVNTAPALNIITVTGTSNAITIGNNVQYTATGSDQYNDPFAITPTWTVSAGGTIDANGLFTSNAFSTSATITATAGGKTGTSTVSIDYPLANIALGKPVTASSLENPTTLASYVNDGDLTTRWSSAASDPQWISIDLQAQFAISKAVLIWETAYSSAYTIQVSNDGNTWATAFTQTTGTGSTETIPLSTVGRYIRMYSTARATIYGNSLYEFQVYGKIVAGTGATLSSIVISPSVAMIKYQQPQTFTATAYDQNGNVMSTTPAWSIIGTGSINATTGVYTPADSTSGNVTIIAKSGLINGQALAVVEAPRKLSKIGILPRTSVSTPLSLAVGIPQQFTSNGFDQYGLPFPITPTYSVSGGGAITQDGFFNPSTAGNYQVYIKQGSLVDTTFVSVQNLSQVNVALFKPVYTSSNENANMSGTNAVDGNSSTRWSSSWTANEWIYVDLQNTYTLNHVVINWESAYATAYDLQVSTDGNSWTNVYSKTGGLGGSESIPLSGQTARYVRVNCTQRALPAYGYSVVELQVYANSVSTSPQLSAIKLTPIVSTVNQSASQQYAATGLDQFGNPIAATISWSESGGGTVSSNGLYTASRVGTYQVNAYSGTVTNSAIVNIESSSVVYAPIPGKIEAESYFSMYGVQTEATGDTGGGLNVGWIDTGDWMDYNVYVATAGTYQLDCRVASIYATGQVQLKSGSIVLATVNVPNTNSWQTWQTVSTNVTLAAGYQTIRLYAASGGFNMNWINFSNINNQGGGTPCQVTGQNSDYAVQVASTANPTFTFVPGTSIAGCAWVLMYPKINGVDQDAITMTKSGTNFTATLTAAVGATVTWYFTYNYPSTGGQKDNAAAPHSVTVGNCSTLKAAEIISDKVVSSKEFIIYPNPNEGSTLYLSFQGYDDPKTIIQILNLSGVVIKERIIDNSTSGSSTSIAISDLPDGLYIVLLKSGSELKQRKLLINR